MKPNMFDFNIESYENFPFKSKSAWLILFNDGKFMYVDKEGHRLGNNGGRIQPRKPKPANKQKFWPNGMAKG